MMAAHAYNRISTSFAGPLLGALACTLALFIGLPLVEYLSTRTRTHPDQLELKTIDTVIPPPAPPKRVEPQQELREKQRPKPRMAKPRTLLPIQAALHLNVPVGDFSSDFAMNFEVDAPDMQNLENYIFEIGELDQRPRARTKPEPTYPPRALVRRTEGFVIVEFIIDETGKVGNITIVESQPEGLFNRAAERAARRWKFDPGTHKGKPVSTRMRQRFDFEL